MWKAAVQTDLPTSGDDGATTNDDCPRCEHAMISDGDLDWEDGYVYESRACPECRIMRTLVYRVVSNRWEVYTQ